MNAAGTTATGVKRGRDPSGKDEESAGVPAGDTSFEVELRSGSIIGIPHTTYTQESINGVLGGTMATGSNRFRIGDGTNATNKGIDAANGDVNEPFLDYDEVNNKWIFSNDGVSSTDVGGGTGTITGGDGIDITAGVTSVDLAASNDLLKFTSGKLDKNVTPTAAEINQLASTTNIAEADTFFGTTNITGAEA